MNTYLALGLLLATAGSISLYLTSPNQRWLDVPWHPMPARLTGGFLMIAGLILPWQAMQPLAAVFTWGIWVMLVFLLYPGLGVLFSLHRKA